MVFIYYFQVIFILVLSPLKIGHSYISESPTFYTTFYIKELSASDLKFGYNEWTMSLPDSGKKDMQIVVALVVFIKLNSSVLFMA